MRASGQEKRAMTDKPRELRPITARPFELIINRDFRSPKCKHRGMRIDANHRRVTCGSCGAELDAFQVLCDLATDWEGFDDSERALKSEIAMLEKRLEIIKELEKNGRARVLRRHLKKLTGWERRQFVEQLARIGWPHDGTEPDDTEVKP